MHTWRDHVVSCRSPDLIVEVSHPLVVTQHGETFVKVADFLASVHPIIMMSHHKSHVTPCRAMQVGSPTALADDALRERLLKGAEEEHGRSIYIATGALWGAHDIQKMADIGTLKVKN